MISEYLMRDEFSVGSDNYTIDKPYIIPSHGLSIPVGGSFSLECISEQRKQLYYHCNWTSPEAVIKVCLKSYYLISDTNTR